MCAQKSGQTYDKIKESGLTIIENEKIATIAEAQTTFECKILNKTILDKACLAPDLFNKFYSNEDFHQLITAEILSVKI